MAKDQFPDDMKTPLVDAFAEYARAFMEAAQSAGSDIVAQLRQLIDAIGTVNRAMHAGTFVAQYIKGTLGPLPKPPIAPIDPTTEAQYQDDLARWVMQAWQINCQVFLQPAMGNHLMLDALHNDTDRGLAGDVLHFFRPVAPNHGNTRDVFRRTARDAAVFTVLLAEAELDGIDRIKRVLDNAKVGITPRAFTAMRQDVGDKAALDRILEEAKRRRDNQQGRSPPRPMDAALIAGPLSDAEQMALYPERYLDLVGFTTAEKRIHHLFMLWLKSR
jgi:hypothetical protein